MGDFLHFNPKFNIYRKKTDPKTEIICLSLVVHAELIAGNCERGEVE